MQSLVIIAGDGRCTGAPGCERIGDVRDRYGAMNDPVWMQMCSLTAFPEIHEIVQTIFE